MVQNVQWTAERPGRWSVHRPQDNRSILRHYPVCEVASDAGESH